MNNPDPLFYFEDERSFADKCVDKILAALGFVMVAALCVVVGLVFIP